MIAREKHYFHGHPFSHVTQWQFALPDPIEGREYRTEHFDSNGSTILRRIDHTWVACGTACLTETVTTLEPATTNLVSKQTFTYGSFLNRTDVYEYGFGAGTPGPLMRRSHTDYLTTNPVNGINYATSLNIRLLSLPTKEQVFNGAGVEVCAQPMNMTTTQQMRIMRVGKSNEYQWTGCRVTTSYGTRGNITATTRHLFNTAGTATGSISTYEQYNVAGNLVKSIDGRSSATQFDFADRFGAPDGNAQANSGAAELGSQTSYAFATKGH